MFGTMMDRPLTLDLIFERGGRYFPRQQIVTRTLSGVHRCTYRDFYHRSKQLMNALHKLGVSEGERVATFCWNHYQHLELYFAVPLCGAVLHTVNLRLFAEQIVFIIAHAQDRILFLDRSLFPLLAPLMDRLDRLELLVLLGEGETPKAPAGKRVLDYEDLIRDESPEFEYLALDERSAAGLCYTSGTTGNPKGVGYTHRSVCLHALALCAVDTIAIRQSDSVLPVVPMFHANAWGLPHAAVMAGAKLVLPGPKMDPASLVQLMREEAVTFSAGVPTIWAGILDLLDKNPGQLPMMERMGVAGSAAPRAMIEGFQERHGIEIIHAWGMTETSPAGTICFLKSDLPQSGPDSYAIRATQGLPLPLFEVKAVGEKGLAVPWDGKTMGDLVVRGPWVSASYFENEEASSSLLTPDGWMKTGDVVTIDSEGYLRIMDRSKDLIKSGGEWISSVDLENLLMAHRDIKEAAVIAMPDPKWQERPLAFIVLRGDHAPTKAELDQFLLQHLAKWQLPDRYEVVKEIPKTSVGKFDKKVLRVMAKEKGIIGGPNG